MSEITIVCCYNNENIYNNFADTLKTQTCKYDLIGINNIGNKNFSSCASAYNSVLKQVRTKYVIFSHQDILLNEPDTLAKFLSYLEQIGQHDILGVAGVKFNESGVFTNILHRWNTTGEISYAGDFRVRGSIMQCDTVDECFFGGLTEHFANNEFDEKICDNWHLYAADSCLHTKQKYAGGALICDIKLLHLSSGNVSFSFHYGFYKLCRKYAKNFPLIKTTCSQCKTDFIHRNYYIIYRGLRCCAKKLLRR